MYEKYKVSRDTLYTPFSVILPTG